MSKTRTMVYSGTPDQREAAYQKDKAAAASGGWAPTRRSLDSDGLRVTYQHDTTVANWPGIAPKPTAPPPGANPAAFALSQMIARYVARGYRVQSQDAFSAVMVTGHRVNHLLHAILTIFLLGLWLFVWVPLAMFGGEKRVLLTVDASGRVYDRPA